MVQTQKVSIIIPVFNGAEHIPGIFKFLTEQSYGNFEAVFVVDKKTTDNTLELIEAQREKVSEVKIVIQTNDGRLGGARNEGLTNSDGDIIWFLDVDDVPALDILEYTISAMESNDADVVMFNSIRSHSADIDLPERNYRIDVMERSDAIIALSNMKLPVTAWSKIIKREILVNNGIEFTHGLAEDIEHTYHTVDKARRVCYCERPLYIYMQHSGSICNSDKHNNTRGKAEVAAYTRLEEYFSNDPKINNHFRKRSTLMRVRSSTHMDKEHFLEYARSEECREMIKKNTYGSTFFELILYRMSPSFYYSLVSFYLDSFYYRDGKYFSKPRRA